MRTNVYRELAKCNTEGVDPLDRENYKGENRKYNV